MERDARQCCTFYAAIASAETQLNMMAANVAARHFKRKKHRNVENYREEAERSVWKQSFP